MRYRLLLLLCAAACGDASGPGPEAPALLAVNGALLPLIGPGDTLAIDGRGLGPAQGSGGVRLGAADLTVLEWNATGILAVAPGTVGEALVVTTDGGLELEPLTVRARPTDTTTTDSRPWAGGADLPRQLGQASAAGIPFAAGAGYTGLIVLTGGRRADGTVWDSTWIGTVGATGAVTAWVAAPDSIVPRARRLHALLGASSLTSRIREDGIAWMIGGVDTDGRALSDVSGIAVGADGSYGLWTPLTQLPGERAAAAAAVGLGAIYVAGGFDASGAVRRELYVAIVNPEGTLNGWFRGPDLPFPLAHAAAAVVDDRLYVTGGVTRNAHPDTTDRAALSDAVLSIRLSRRTGFVADTAWTVEAATLLDARARHAVFAAAGGLVVVGGVLADPAGPETESGRIAAGTLGTFQARAAAGRPAGPARDFAAPVLLDGTGIPVVTVAGGTDSLGPSLRVWWH